MHILTQVRVKGRNKHVLTLKYLLVGILKSCIMNSTMDLIDQDHIKNLTVYEPKQRMIYAPAFRDTVVQHAIYRIIYSVFDKTFIDQSFACRKNMGTHKCSKKTQKYMRACGDNEYTLKLDIRKFFYSNRLGQFLRKTN